MISNQELPSNLLPHRISGNGPALILVHNGFYSQVSWDPIRSLLDQFFTCFSFDRAGYGDAAGQANSSAGLESGVTELEQLVKRLEKSGQLKTSQLLCIEGGLFQFATAL